MSQNRNLGRTNIVPKGNYTSGVTYYKLDVVLHSGNSYCAKQESINIEPSVTSGWGDYWMLLAQKGDTGQKGDKGDTGSTGLQGDKGDKGDTGATGATGAKGDTGATGQAATVTVGTTTTGAAGTQASVSNSGTESDAVLNFTIPQGATGAGVPDGGTDGQIIVKSGVSAVWQDQNTVDGIAAIDGNIPLSAARQYSTMPTVTTADNGTIAQYIGTDETTYKTGHWYEVVNGAWEEIVYGDPNSVSYDTQTDKTDAQKAQARTNVGAADVTAFSAHYTNGVVDGLGLGTPATGSGNVDVSEGLAAPLRTAISAESNQNLLDNYYFTSARIINQRGATTYVAGSGTNTSTAYYTGASGFAMDRWKVTSGSAVITADGLILDGTINQTLPIAVGTDICASVKMHSGAATASYDDVTKTFTITSSGGTIIAAKLEKGSISSIADDTLPNKDLEYIKCLRYLRTLNSYAVCYSNGYLQPIYFETPMYATPTASSSKVLSGNGVTVYPVVNVGMAGSAGVSFVEATGVVAGTFYRVGVGCSCEL